jgi:Fur family transcriptional regulator, ferric uptake regulator
MSQTGTSRQQLLERMRQAGLRLTKQRIAMANLMTLWQHPFTSAELIVDLKRSGMGVHRATVFRDLNLLSEKGILREVKTANQKGRYFALSHDRSGHFLVCERCNKVIEVTAGEMMPVLKQWTELAPAAKDWKIRAHEVESYGLCPECQRVLK